jgi:hypothetical protein
MNTTAKPVKGQKVSVDDPQYSGIWTVVSAGPVNVVLEQEGRGKRLRCPQSLLIEPTTEAAAPTPTVFFNPGELVRIERGKFAGLWVVIADRGDDKLNLAKLGGDNGHYLRMPRRGLTKVDPAEVLK